MKVDPDWSLYRTFLAVLQDGSLSAAARRLGITQPSVARHIEALEAAIGADLFVRSQRGLASTDLARSLQPHAETIAASTAALLRTASGTIGEVAGTVRISASEVIGVEHLPPILARLRREHPRLAIELALTDRVDDLLRRDADLAVRNVAPTQAALLAKQLPPLELGFHASPAYLERRGTPASLAALAGHDIIGFDNETPAVRSVLAHLPGLEPDGFALRTDSNVAQFAAIRAGFGIGLCQAGLARRERSLVRVLPELAIPLPLWIVMHEDLKTTARFRLVFDALATALRDTA